MTLIRNLGAIGVIPRTQPVAALLLRCRLGALLCCPVAGLPHRHTLSAPPWLNGAPPPEACAAAAERRPPAPVPLLRAACRAPRCCSPAPPPARLLQRRPVTHVRSTPREVAIAASQGPVLRRRLVSSGLPEHVAGERLSSLEQSSIYIPKF